jgi:cytochrome c oxidase assembly protein subunit 15
MEMQQNKGNRAIVIWLFTGVAMIIIQVLLGGITRLTGSGLSITEWKPILGALPPMNEAAWQAAFEKYQQIGQSKYINSHFTLSDFKWIYFWEWLHRNWARLIGVVFFVPFVWFIIKKKIDRSMINPMIVLFLLGALQGLIGWIMVKSGLNEENLYVSHIRLAIHFMAALGLLWYVLWFALKLSIPASAMVQAPGLRKLSGWILGLLVLQLIYGAFMAGLHAALAATTWPSINGAFVPSGMLSQGGFLEDITHNQITIQFIHRSLAYLLTLLIAVWYLRSAKLPQLATVRALALLVVLLQVFLGVLTVMNSEVKIPLGFALAHQFTGMALLMVMIWGRFVTPRPSHI